MNVWIVTAGAIALVCLVLAFACVLHGSLVLAMVNLVGMAGALVTLQVERAHGKRRVELGR